MDRRDFIKSTLLFLTGGIAGTFTGILIPRGGKGNRITVKEHCVMCGGCSAVCPVQCIDFVFPGVRIDESRCIFCRECEIICPVRAIEIK